MIVALSQTSVRSSAVEHLDLVGLRWHGNGPDWRRFENTARPAQVVDFQIVPLAEIYDLAL